MNLNLGQTNTLSPLKTQGNYYKYPRVLLEIGIKRVKLELLEHHPEHVCLINEIYTILLEMLNLMKLSNERFVTLELVPKLKWAILKDKSFFLDKLTLPTRWLQISALGLIGKEKDFLPFWNNQSKALSEKLWLPTKIDYQESHSTSLNTSSTFMEHPSWFSIKRMNNQLNKNSPKTSCPWSMSTLVNKWENADILNQIRTQSNKKSSTRSHASKPTPNGVLKIRILPTQKQQHVFKRWIGGSNYTYNMALVSLQQKQTPVHFHILAFKFAVDTDRYGERNSNIPEWLSLTPSAIRKSILNELVTAYEVARKNRMLGHTSSFTVDKKKKKNQRCRFSFPIPKESTKLYVDPLKPDEYRLDICSSKMKQCMENKTRVLKKTYPMSLMDKCRLEQERLDIHEYFPDIDYSLFDSLVSSMDSKLSNNPCIGLENFKIREIDDVITCYNECDYSIMNIDKLIRMKRYNSSLPKPKTNSKLSKSQKQPESIASTSIRIHRYSRIGRNKYLDKLNMKIEFDCRLCYRYGHWFIHIPYRREQYREPEKYGDGDGDGDRDRVVALDPGFTTFQSFYSQDECGKYQQNVKRLEKLCSLLDYYKWCLDNKWHASKYVRWKTNRLYRKQFHLIDEMHTKIINDLTSRYNWILLPSFETQDMTKGKGYTASQRATKRHAAQLSHFKFKQRLIHRCSQMKHCKVLIVSEAWTTKTCSYCGWIWEKMTMSNREFICKGECGGIYDRDVNAARNILLRSLTG